MFQVDLHARQFKTICVVRGVGKWAGTFVGQTDSTAFLSRGGSVV